MMTKETLTDLSEVMESFNRSEYADLLKEQISSEYSEMNGIPMDYFKPLYYKYNSVINDFAMTTELKEEITQKYYDLSMMFIEQIEAVFGLKIDRSYLMDDESNIPGVALALYDLFVIEFNSNLEDCLHNYIMTNKVALVQLFESLRNKRDAATISCLKVMDADTALLVANIYTVAKYAINEMSEEEFTESLPDGYVPGEIFKGLSEKGVITGDFMVPVRDMFLSSAYLSNQICFDIIGRYQKKSSTETVEE